MAMIALSEITREELSTYPLMSDERVLEKAYLLANGMVKVYGFDRQKAIEQALKLARNWFKNNGEYTIKLK